MHITTCDFKIGEKLAWPLTPLRGQGHTYTSFFTKRYIIFWYEILKYDILLLESVIYGNMIVWLYLNTLGRVTDASEELEHTRVCRLVPGQVVSQESERSCSLCPAAHCSLWTPGRHHVGASLLIWGSTQQTWSTTQKPVNNAIMCDYIISLLNDIRGRWKSDLICGTDERWGLTLGLYYLYNFYEFICFVTYVILITFLEDLSDG